MLTPEDQKRIEEEERYRAEVRARLEAKTTLPSPPKTRLMYEPYEPEQKSNFGRILVIACLAAVAIAWAFVIVTHGSPASSVSSDNTILPNLSPLETHTVASG